MPPSTLLLALLAFALIFAPVVPARAQGTSPEVVDRVVAVVRIRVGGAQSDRAFRRQPVRAATEQETLPPDVITHSGLEFEARVAMVSRGAVGAATAELDEDTLRSALDNAIWERLLAGEADVLQAFRVEPQEVEAAVRAFRSKFRSEGEFEAFLAQSEMDLQALSRVLERSIRAGKVLDSKVRLRAQVSESEVRRYYDAQRDVIGQPFDQVRSALREKLFRERYGELVRRELAQLERAHDVRRVSPLAQERGRAGG